MFTITRLQGLLDFLRESITEGDRFQRPPRIAG